MKLIIFTTGFNDNSKTERALMDSMIKKFWKDSRRRGWGCQLFVRHIDNEYFLCRSIDQKYDIREKNYCSNKAADTNCTDRVTNWEAIKINADELGIIDEIDISELRTPYLHNGTVRLTAIRE